MEEDRCWGAGEAPGLEAEVVFPKYPELEDWVPGFGPGRFRESSASSLRRRVSSRRDCFLRVSVAVAERAEGEPGRRPEEDMVGVLVSVWLLVTVEDVKEEEEE